MRRTLNVVLALLLIAVSLDLWFWFQSTGNGRYQVSAWSGRLFDSGLAVIDTRTGSGAVHVMGPVTQTGDAAFQFDSKGQRLVWEPQTKLRSVPVDESGQPQNAFADLIPKKSSFFDIWVQPVLSSAAAVILIVVVVATVAGGIIYLLLMAVRDVYRLKPGSSPPAWLVRLFP
jgi:hypothetical protein